VGFGCSNDHIAMITGWRGGELVSTKRHLTWRDVTVRGDAPGAILPISALVSDNVRRTFALGRRPRRPDRAGGRAAQVLKGLPGHRVLTQNGANGHGEQRQSLPSVCREAGADRGGGADGS
jgi:hypothetical protein